MVPQKEFVIGACVVAFALMFNGLCQRYEPTNSGQNGLCARFDKLLGEHQQKMGVGKWENVAAITDGVPVR